MTLDRVDWNAEIIRPADLEASVRKLKAQAGGRLHTGGSACPSPLVQLGLVDEFEFVVHPAVAGRGPDCSTGCRHRCRSPSWGALTTPPAPSPSGMPPWATSRADVLTSAGATSRGHRAGVLTSRTGTAPSPAAAQSAARISA